jgi:hypothetical protein
MVNVTKWDGRIEPFSKNKLLRTVMRVGASRKVALIVVDTISKEAYDGITTKEILDRTFSLLKDYEPIVNLLKDLRTALKNIKSFPDFEEYVRLLLGSHGYKVSPNIVIQGFCVTHEIDGVLEKNGRKLYLEAKHHSEPHISTPFNVTLSVKAKWDDIEHGFREGLNDYHFDSVLIVCNTRLTKHAEKYARCVGLEHIGWNSPTDSGIESLIAKTNFYPVTILKSLTNEEYDLLSAQGILSIKQIVEFKLAGIEIRRARKEELIYDI